MSTPFAEGEEELYNEINKNWLKFKEVALTALKLKQSDSKEDHEKLMHIFHVECVEAANLYMEAMEKLEAFQNAQLEVSDKAAKSAAASTNNTTLFISIFGVLLGLSLGFIVAMQISKEISRITNSISENVEVVASAATQLAATSTQLSQATTEQAASLQETSSSVEEISSMVNKNTDNSRHAASASNETQIQAENGQNIVNKMKESMSDINQSNEQIISQVNESNNEMMQIIDVIQEIGNKTKIINDIVFQTKLLSFNASVEAARAGEQGKGFAVVAEEIGNLAQLSGNAAKEITEILSGSTAKVENIVNNTKEKIGGLVSSAGNKVKVGLEIAAECQESLREIVDKVTKVSQMAGEISVASQEQSTGVNEINKALTQLDTVTQMNSSASEESAKAAEELSSQAENMKVLMGDLLAVVNGSGATSQNKQSHQPKKQQNNKPDNVYNLVRKEKPKTTHKASVTKKAHIESSAAPDYNDPGFNET